MQAHFHQSFAKLNAQIEVVEEQIDDVEGKMGEYSSTNSGWSP